MATLSSEKFADLHSRLMGILSADTTVSFGRVQTAFSFDFCGKTCYGCVAAWNDQVSSPEALVSLPVPYAGVESRSKFLGRVAPALLSGSSSLPSWFCGNPFDRSPNTVGIYTPLRQAQPVRCYEEGWGSLPNSVTKK